MQHDNVLKKMNFDVLLSRLGEVLLAKCKHHVAAFVIHFNLTRKMAMFLEN